MREFRVDPSVGEVDEMDDLYEVNRDTDEWDIFPPQGETSSGME